MNTKHNSLPIGLTLVMGLSYELIADKLTNEGLPWKLWSYEEGKGYFRSSSIEIDPISQLSGHQRISLAIRERTKMQSDMQRKIVELLGYPDHLSQNTYSYFSLYQIKPEFDLSHLSGTIKLNQGKLVERTLIYIRL